MMSFFDSWAKGLIFISRGSRYITILNTFMLSKIFWDTFENKSLAMGLMVAGLISLIIVAVVDYFNIIGREQGVIFKKNHEWIKMKEQLNRIERKLQRRM